MNLDKSVVENYFQTEEHKHGKSSPCPILHCRLPEVKAKKGKLPLAKGNIGGGK